MRPSLYISMVLYYLIYYFQPLHHYCQIWNWFLQDTELILFILVKSTALPWNPYHFSIKKFLIFFQWFIRRKGPKFSLIFHTKIIPVSFVLKQTYLKSDATSKTINQFLKCYLFFTFTCVSRCMLAEVPGGVEMFVTDGALVILGAVVDL